MTYSLEPWKYQCSSVRKFLFSSPITDSAFLEIKVISKII
jgi:hypothetical protein